MNMHHRGLTPYNYNNSQQELIQESTEEYVDYSPIDEYLQGYFGDSLTEDVSDDDVIEAFAKLIETARAVEEYCINEGLMDKVKSAGKAIASGAKKVAQKVGIVKKPLRDISSRTPERQATRDKAAQIARNIRKGIQKREAGHKPMGLLDPDRTPESRRQETERARMRLGSAARRSGGQVGRVLAKTKKRVERSDRKMISMDDKPSTSPGYRG